MKGYYTNEAILVGVESRTSSPIKVPRDRETFQHPQVAGLFPCGEGAGYAGGIISAAIDGVNCADGVMRYFYKRKQKIKTKKTFRPQAFTFWPGFLSGLYARSMPFIIIAVGFSQRVALKILLIL
jgi:hypothetical protein